MLGAFFKEIEMGGAIGSVMGGGLFNLALNRVSQIFPASQVAKAVGQLVGKAIGQGIEDGVKSLVQGHGMPKFVAEAVKKAVQDVMGKQEKSPADLAEAVGRQYANEAQDFKEAFTKGFIAQTVENMKDKRKGSSSWYEAMAEALGKALNDQAKEVEELSSKITSESAKDDPKGMTDLQAAQQRMQFMMSAIDQVLKGVGEALKQLAGRN
jgi:flagellar hook-basal body complex protein FliE